jgi:hypothetical protein
MSDAKMIDEQVRVNRELHFAADRVAHAVDFLFLFLSEIEAIDSDEDGSDLAKALQRADKWLGELLRLLDKDFLKWRDMQIDADTGVVRT